VSCSDTFINTKCQVLKGKTPVFVRSDTGCEYDFYKVKYRFCKVKYRFFKVKCQNSLKWRIPLLGSKLDRRATLFRIILLLLILTLTRTPTSLKPILEALRR
jgi:hypothetical protein